MTFVGETTNALPPLETGDRLTSAEFLRRWEAMPELKLAELIEGVVYLTPFVTASHGERHCELVGLMGVYSAYTPGVTGGNNGTVLLDSQNVPQPDGYLRLITEAGGQSNIEADYVAGAPEFIAEVAVTCASYDLHDKLLAYRRNGVREYVVWRVWDKAVDWFVLEGGQFEKQSLGDDGVYRSRAMPGLWLDAEAVLAGDLAKALATLQHGLASAEHRKFASELEKKLAS